MIAKGDIVFYLWHRRGFPPRPEWAEVSSASSLSPNIVFGRNQDGKARAIPIDSITRIKPANKENT